jgi:hypothetical protein
MQTATWWANRNSSIIRKARTVSTRDGDTIHTAAASRTDKDPEAKGAAKSLSPHPVLP